MPIVIIYHLTVMPRVDGQGGVGVKLTLLQPGGADYAHLITASPPGFENPAASLYLEWLKYSMICSFQVIRDWIMGTVP